MVSMMQSVRIAAHTCLLFAFAFAAHTAPPGGQNCQVGDSLTGCNITGPGDAICVGTSFTFTIIPSVDWDYYGDGVGRVQDDVTTTVNWGDGTTNSYSSGSGVTTISAAHAYSSGGTKTINITCNDVPTYANDTGTQAATCTVDVCPSITDIQYQNPCTMGWESANGASVLSGTTVTFRVVPAGDYPSDEPTWGGSSGASGTGVTTTVTFAGSGQQTVTATCCDTKSVTLCVYNLYTYLLPEDLFSGRSIDRYGVGEPVDIGWYTDQQCCTDDWDWSLESGPGTLNGSTNTAELPGVAVLRLTCWSGPCCGTYYEFSKAVVPLDGGYMVQRPGTNIRHTQGLCGVGFRGDIYLLPKDVSFWNAQFQEGTCTGVGSGYYGYHNGDVHSASGWKAINKGNIATGCQVSVPDTVDTGDDYPPFGIGSFDWPIPWEYSVDGATAHNITTVHHHMMSGMSGTATIEKAGAGPFSRAASDPTSGYWIQH